MIYFLQGIDGGPIKIGRSDKPEERLKQVAPWCPVPILLLCSIEGGKELERNIQDCFADCHSHYEWFRPERRLLVAIMQLRAGLPVEQAIDLSDRRGNTLGQVQSGTRARNGSATGRPRRAKVAA